MYDAGQLHNGVAQLRMWLMRLEDARGGSGFRARTRPGARYKRGQDLGLIERLSFVGIEREKYTLMSTPMTLLASSVTKALHLAEPSVLLWRCELRIARLWT